MSIISSSYQWPVEGSLDFLCEQKWENNFFECRLALKNFKELFG